MKHELVKLVVHLLWNWMVVYSNLAKHELNFLFVKISFLARMSRDRQTLAI